MSECRLAMQVRAQVNMNRLREADEEWIAVFHDLNEPNPYEVNGEVDLYPQGTPLRFVWTGKETESGDLIVVVPRSVLEDYRVQCMIRQNTDVREETDQES